jgi:endonuclease/exonuclease/phosphatase family metal-dependent hydrolase
MAKKIYSCLNNKKCRISGALLALLFLLLSCTPKEKPAPVALAPVVVAPEAAPEQGSITVASFNIQIFGASKMAKPEVVTILTDIVSRYDVVAVQEVRSASEEPVLQFMSRLPETYDYVLGPREGRSSSKEQYWVIYDKSKLTVLGSETWPDETDIFERNPLAVYFTTRGNFDFILINNHIQPSDAAKEINALPEVAVYFRELWNESDVLLMGDFNADGAYYNEVLLSDVFSPDDYISLITDDYDTTVASGENTYDRFIISLSAREDFAGTVGVLRFEDTFDFTPLSIAPKAVSDHYPIWAEFFIHNDTD